MELGDDKEKCFGGLLDQTLQVCRTEVLQVGNSFWGHKKYPSPPASLWKLNVKVGCLGLPSWKNGKEAQSRFSFCKWDFWSCIFDVKIVIWKYLFPLCFAFCQIQYYWDPNEHDLASCQTKHIPAKCLIMEMNMWWESFLCMFHGNKLLMKLQKQSFLPCSLNLNT